MEFVIEEVAYCEEEEDDKDDEDDEEDDDEGREERFVSGDAERDAKYVDGGRGDDEVD